MGASGTIKAAHEVLRRWAVRKMWLHYWSAAFDKLSEASEVEAPLL